MKYDPKHRGEGSRPGVTRIEYTPATRSALLLIGSLLLAGLLLGILGR